VGKASVQTSVQHACGRSRWRGRQKHGAVLSSGVEQSEKRLGCDVHMLPNMAPWALLASTAIMRKPALPAWRAPPARRHTRLQGHQARQLANTRAVHHHAVLAAGLLRGPAAGPGLRAVAAAAAHGRVCMGGWGPGALGLLATQRRPPA